MKRRIKAIIWDFGNILGRFDHLKACRKLARYGSSSPESIYALLFSGVGAPTKLHEAGVLSSHQFFQTVRNLLGLSKELSFREFSSIWKDIFSENEGVGTVIGAIRPNVVQCILWFKERNKRLSAWN